MSPYVGSPLSLGGAECSERDESGIFSTFGTDVGVWKAHTTSQGGGWGFYLAVWHSTKASGVTTERGWERALKPPLLFLIFDPALNLIKLVVHLGWGDLFRLFFFSRGEPAAAAE